MAAAVETSRMMVKTPDKHITKIMAAAAMAAAAIIPTACIDSHPVWSCAVKTPADGWTNAQKIVFTPDSASVATTHPSRMILFVRYKTETNTHHLLLAFDFESVAGISADTINIPLFHPDGKPVGKGNLGILETCDTITLPHPILPGWEATVTPATGMSVIKGINTIGITLIP